MWIVLSEKAGTSATSALQAAAKRRDRPPPMALAIIFTGVCVMLLHRPDQPDAAFDLAIVEHDGRRGHLHGGAARTLVDQQPGARIVEMAERVVERDRPVALALVMVSSRVSAPCPDGCRWSAVGDDEALRRQRLQPDIIDAAGDGALDPWRRASCSKAVNRMP
jgi:hypothetical protein